ncbi:unnamed protein product [Symbiodinium sp. CCMP2592]|nr:unnamed protein product [Symbiodinium sp. CCMP2592]
MLVLATAKSSPFGWRKGAVSCGGGTEVTSSMSPSLKETPTASPGIRGTLRSYPSSGTPWILWRSHGPTTGGEVNLDTATTTKTTSRILTRSIRPGEMEAGGSGKAIRKLAGKASGQGRGARPSRKANQSLRSYHSSGAS